MKNIVLILILCLAVACSKFTDLGEYKPKFYDTKAFNGAKGNVKRIEVLEQRGKIVKIDSLRYDTIMYDAVNKYDNSTFDKWGRTLISSTNGEEFYEYSYDKLHHTKTLVRDKNGAILYQISYDWASDTTYVMTYKNKTLSISVDYQGFVNEKDKCLREYRDETLSSESCYGENWMSIKHSVLDKNGNAQLQPVTEVSMLPDSVWLKSDWSNNEGTNELIKKTWYYAMAKDERGNINRAYVVEWNKDSVDLQITKQTCRYIYRD